MACLFPASIMPFVRQIFQNLTSPGFSSRVAHHEHYFCFHFEKITYHFDQVKISLIWASLGYSRYIHQCRAGNFVTSYSISVRLTTDTIIKTRWYFYEFNANSNPEFLTEANLRLGVIISNNRENTNRS